MSSGFRSPFPYKMQETVFYFAHCSNKGKGLDMRETMGSGDLGSDLILSAKLSITGEILPPLGAAFPLFPATK